jgi:mono/diheme cytochrome c family protein
MNYPVWEVPIIGGPWVIGIIAIFHVMISQFAVGGGVYLAWAESKAIKEKRPSWLPIIERHSKFFLLLTAIFGTVSGVGIWFAIGLVQPEATSTLIHNFVFGWAIEWVFFLVELTAAAVYYYSWRRVSERTHLKVGYLYAVASVCTLVIINGILSFMLTPGGTWLGVAGTGNESAYFWNAFFNPTYWPSLVLRSLVCLNLAGIWALVSLSKIDEPAIEKPRIEMIRWSTTWLAPAFLLMPFAFAWYFLQVPSSNKHLLELGMSTIGSGAFTQVTRISLLTVLTTATVGGVAYLFAYRYPKDFSFSHAVAILALALGATASTEYGREAIRKPFVIGAHMYSNGIRARDVQRLNQQGFLTASMWTPSGPSTTLLDRGKAMFRGQCMACHTIDGYRSMRRLIQDRDSKAIGNILTMLRQNKPDSPYHAYMPPLVGTDDEVAALQAYLTTLSAVPPSATVAKAPAAPAPVPAVTVPANTPAPVTAAPAHAERTAPGAPKGG